MDWINALFPSLTRFWDTSAGHLSGGQKQMLAIAKVFVEPKRLILIDEPTKGLAPSVVAELIVAIDHLTKQGTSILLVEQNFHFAASLAREVTVLDSGKTSWQGLMDEIVKSESLRTQLLGVSLL
jgi:branched-chain amino acid transport system ATP-binding protein